MGVKETMMNALGKLTGKKKEKKQTYYEYGKEVIGKEGEVKKRKKKTQDIYKELFPND
ncbi:MAG: hypothetical protein ACWGQW_22630 [bacterium]